MRLLLIDDAKSQYALIQQILLPVKHQHFEVDWVANYDDALDTLTRNLHDVALVDYQLGDHTGIEVIEQALARGCTVPLILLTGVGDYRIDVAAMQAGAADYLDKTEIRLATLERSIRYAYERSQAQKTLQESEERYRDLFENSRELIQSVDPDGRFLYVNRCWRETLGYDEAAVGRLSIAEIIRADDLPQMRAFLEQVITGKEARNIETVFLTNDGREIIVEGDLSCRFVNGKPVAARGIFRDITARKQAERAEHEQRALAEALRDTAEALNSTRDFDEILDHILINVARVAPHDYANITLIQSGIAHIARSRATPGSRVEAAIQDLTFVVAETPSLAQIEETGLPLVIADVAQAEGWVERPMSAWVRSYAGIPISLEEDVIGFLNLYSAEPNSFNPTLSARLQAFSNQIALAIHNARHYEQAQELAALNERQRLARELHDAVSQTLFSASLIAETLSRTAQDIPDQMRQDLRELWLLNRRALAEMRTLLLELRPRALVETPIEELIRHVVEAFSSRGQSTVTLNLESRFSLPGDVQVMLYRIAQEALNNIAKHAHAHQVMLTLRHRDQGLELQIADDGSGFDPARVSSSHFGTRIMQERAEAIDAQFVLSSQIGKGTTITVIWPAPNP